ncbi:MAG: phosphodiester glycosidase family protein [Nannocystaceae bacterium]
MSQDLHGTPFVDTIALDFLEHPRVLAAALPNRGGRWSQYGCLPGFRFDGSERVYAVELAWPGQLAAEVEVVRGSNVVVAILDPSDENLRCLAGDPRRAVAEDLDPGVYWIVVDGAAAAGGGATEYRLAVEPEAYDAWVEREVAPGVVWQRWFGRRSVRSVNVLRVSRAARMAGHEVAGMHAGGRCEAVGAMGEHGGAFAGVNASFHRRLAEDGSSALGDEEGESFVVTRCEPDLGIVKIDGELLAHSVGTRVTFGADASGEIRMREVEAPDSWDEVPTAFGGHPSLIPYRGGSEVTGVLHPRTAIGISADDELIMATVDGRTAVGEGFSLPQTAELMRELGAVTAINLDGGGSTTMWIRGTTLSGVVNYPSDGWSWGTHPDHEHSRSISDGLFLFSP